MIRKNILAIALLGVFGLTHAADVENLRTLSYLNEPLRLQADVIGEGEIILAAPTEYLRLNHPIPSYDLSIDVVEQNGQKQVILTTTEGIESPALTLLLEGRDKDNRRQLFELPIILDFKPEAVVEIDSAKATDSEIVIDGAAVVDARVSTTATDKVVLSDVPAITKAKTDEKITAKVENKVATAPTKPAVKTAAKQKRITDPELVQRYPVAKGETLWSIANSVRPTNVTPQKMIEIIKANNPSAFTSDGVLRSDVTLLIPKETAKVQHKFVASADSKDARIGYIYELPEPPVAQVAEVKPEVAVAENTDDVAVKVVRPVADGEEVAVAEQIVDSAEAIQPEVLEPQTSEVVITESVVPVVESVVETVRAEVVEPIKAEEPVKVEEAKPVEPPKKRPVYIMPEPEPEPGIIELIFDNIAYIGAGVLVLILGLLAVVMRRRKQGDTPKQPKEKKAKASKGLFGKKKADVAPVEEDVVEVAETSEASNAEAIKVAPIATAIATAAAVTAVVTPKAEAKDETAIESLDFDLSFVDNVETSVAVEEEKEEAGLEFDLSELNLDVVEAAVVEPKVEEVEGALDFDLSSLDLGEAVVEVNQPKVEEFEGGLDFDLSSLDLDATVQEPEAPKVEESMGGLDFDLSSLDLGSAIPEAVEETKAEEYGGLDFDLSAFSTPSVDAEVPKEDTFDMAGALEFDLGDFKIEAEPVAEVAVEEIIETPVVSEIEEESFGENNPLFAPQTDSDIEPISMDESMPESGEPEEYISFPDLLENAEDALVQDDIEAEKPADFASFLENEEVALDSLMEVSKRSDAEPKLDLAFVADSDDDASMAFLESLDAADEIILDDPIDSSVKDNASKSVEMMDIPEAIEIDLPEVEIEPEVTIDLDSLDLPTFDSNIVEDVVMEEIDIPEMTLMEPVVEEILEPEPVIETVEEVPVIVDPLSVEGLDNQDADFESEQVKLELAVAYMGFDLELARPLLDEVIKDGNPAQVQRAQALLAQID